MQLFGHESEEYFQLQFPKGTGNDVPYGVSLIGGKTSSHNQNPYFKIIEVDKQYLVPQKVTVYEFDLDKANS